MFIGKTMSELPFCDPAPLGMVVIVRIVTSDEILGNLSDMKISRHPEPKSLRREILAVIPSVTSAAMLRDLCDLSVSAFPAVNRDHRPIHIVARLPS